MKWFCFKFWFGYRLYLACLQHFNFVIAIYTNCVYFTLWKIYDLLWFWMHLMLCTCFPQLRRENYLLVWCNLIKKRKTQYPNSTYKEIYLALYGGPGTKAEAALQNMHNKEMKEREERMSRRSKRRQSRMRAKMGESVPEEDLESSSSSDDDDMENAPLSAQQKRDLICEQEENECRKYAYVGTAVEDSNKDLESAAGVASEEPTAPPRKRRLNAGKDNENHAAIELDDISADPVVEVAAPEDVSADGEDSDTNSTSKWIDKVPAVPKIIKNRFNRLRQTTEPEPEQPRPSWVKPPDEDTMSISSAWTKFKGAISNVSLPKFNRSASNNGSQSVPVDVLRPDYTNTYDISDPKLRAKREKRDKKALTKRLRAKIKAELEIAAKEEKRRRMVTDAIELILSLLRMIAAFFILVGNIRKTFPMAQVEYLRGPKSYFETSVLASLYRVTIFLEVLMFSVNFLWIYCLQWHLCCRLGLVRFFFWSVVLSLLAGFTMLYPMSVAMKEMDVSWCQFQNGSFLEKYQPSWHR